MPSPTERSHVPTAYAQALFAELRCVYERLPEALGPVGDESCLFPLASVEALLASTSRWSGNQALGLTLARRETSALYPGLESIRTAATLRGALDALQQVRSPLPGVTYELSYRGRLATFVCREEHKLPLLGRFHAEYVLSKLLQACRLLHPQRSIAVHRALFRHAPPRLRAQHAEVFAGPVRFGQQEDSITLPRELLDAPTTQLASATPVSCLLSEQIRTLLRALSCLDVDDTAQVACSLGISQRALRRRLSAEGTSISVLLDEERMRLACEMLAHRATLEVVVVRTGFANTQNFERAFRRWTGLSPRDYVWRLGGTPLFRARARSTSSAPVLRPRPAWHSPLESDQSSA